MKHGNEDRHAPRWARDPLSRRMLGALSDARKESGKSLRALQAETDLSPSFLSLVLAGHRRASEETVEALADALGIDDRTKEDLLRWARLTGREEPTRLLEVARELEEQHSELVARPASDSEVALRPSPTPHRAAAAPAPTGPRRDRIPVVPPGVVPPAGSETAEGESIEIAGGVLMEGDELYDPFAWRLDRATAESVGEVLQVGDLVVLSRLPVPDSFSPEDVWLVELDGQLRLTFVEEDGSPRRPTSAAPERDESPARPHHLAKVVTAIRTWSRRRS